MKNYILGLSGICLVFFLLIWGNWSISLWDEDEAAYALFGQNMLQTGDWVEPQATWSDIHRKTPFHFWTISLSYLIFGVNEWAVRFPAVVAILATLGLVFGIVRRFFSSALAWGAVWVLGTSIFVPTLAKISLTDAWLLFATTAAMGTLYGYLQTRAWVWLLGFTAAVGLGVLVKGPPVLILAGGVWLGLLIFSQKRAWLLDWKLFLFGFLSILPFVAWMYASYQKDGGVFLSFLYDWYVAKRVGGSVLGQSGWAGYHLGMLHLAFLGFLPMLWLFFGAQLGGSVLIFKSWKTLPENARENYLFAGLWLFWGWIFYELMSSKLPSYSLAVHPLLGIFIAHTAQNMLASAQVSRFWAWACGVYGLIWMAFAGALLVAPHLEILKVFNLNIWASLPAAVFILIMLVWMLKSGWTLARMGILSAGTQLLVWMFAAPQVEQSPVKSFPKIPLFFAETPNCQPKHFHLVGMHTKQTRPSLLFYLKNATHTETTIAQADSILQIIDNQAVKNPCEEVFILGTEADSLYQKIKTQPNLHIRRLDWVSTDDKFKPHTFVIVWKK